MPVVGPFAVHNLQISSSKFRHNTYAHAPSSVVRTRHGFSSHLSAESFAVLQNWVSCQCIRQKSAGCCFQSMHSNVKWFSLVLS